MSQQSIDKIKRRIRQKVKGTAEKPRLSIFRSNSHIYAQLIDDVVGKTLLSSSTLELAISSKTEATSTCEASILSMNLGFVTLL
jgi:large subunit ribosomal protein L18